MIDKDMSEELTNQAVPRAKLSAVVISYNRAELIATCLHGLAFADELIVVDKSSTDGTAEIAATVADRVISVPWSPVVEETRAFAVAACTYDWVMLFDDDECLSPESAPYIDALLQNPQAQVYRLPLRHYIMARHDERAYYWPEHHPRLFHRSVVKLASTVHSGIQFSDAEVATIAPESGVCIHHLSHRDVAQWIEKSNRYTSMPDRSRVPYADNDVIAFSHAAIEQWAARCEGIEPGSYTASLAVLRALYDIIDRLKIWEESEGLDGVTAFRELAAQLDAQYALLRPRGTGRLSQSALEIASDQPQCHPIEKGLTELEMLLGAIKRNDEKSKDNIAALIETLHQLTNDELQQAAQLKSSLEAEVVSATLLKKSFNAKNVAYERLHIEMQNLRKETDSLYERLNIENDRALAREARLHDDAVQISSLTQRLHEVETSLLWKMSIPLRSAASRHPALAALSRRTVKVLWWTVTLQLKKRLAERKK